VSLLLKALKQAESAPADTRRAPRDDDLELQPLADDGVRGRGWVEPPSLLFGNTAAGDAHRQGLRWPRLSLVPATLLLAALIALGYGAWLYFSLQPPAALPTPTAAAPAELPVPAASVAASPPAAPLESAAPAPPRPAATPPVRTPVRSAFAAVATPPPPPRVPPAARDHPAPTARPLPQFQPDAHTTLLAQAWAAYQRGALAEAQRLYTEAQARQPGTDALLGLAAIAALQNRDAEAQGLYREVLALDPRNAAAQAALFDLVGNTDAAATESRLKMLIEREPSPQLHQTLANLYAEQGRWREAQAAYFDAWRGAPDNADYAYNLAVSLDQLREHAAALTYYEKALGAGGAHRFDRTQAETRVRQLETLR
jgi:tetratricopeptide (TPR) repeat protein